jgi:hypothetical protein
VRHDGTSHADEPKEVGLKNRLCLVDRTLFCSGGRNAEAGVVHEQVDAAFQANEFLYGGFDLCIAGNVERQHCERPLARLGATSAGAVDLVARRCEPLRSGFADA